MSLTSMPTLQLPLSGEITLPESGQSQLLISQQSVIRTVGIRVNGDQVHLILCNLHVKSPKFPLVVFTKVYDVGRLGMKLYKRHILAKVGQHRDIRWTKSGLKNICSHYKDKGTTPMAKGT